MPTASYFGRNSFVGIGPETSGYGTAAAEAAVTRPIISCTMLRQIDKVPRPNLRVQGVAGLRASHYLSADRSTGSLELEATYDNVGYYLKAALGATSAGTPNTHTYTLGDVPIEGNTLFLQRGTSDNYERFEGVVINSMSCSVAAGEHMTMSFDLIGETSSSSAGSARHDSSIRPTRTSCCTITPGRCRIGRRTSRWSILSTASKTTCRSGCGWDRSTPSSQPSPTSAMSP